jgi:hypothetical protein
MYLELIKNGNQIETAIIANIEISKDMIPGIGINYTPKGEISQFDFYPTIKSSIKHKI